MVLSKNCHTELRFMNIFSFFLQQAKAQKKEIEAKKRYVVEKDSEKLTTSLKTQGSPTQSKTNFTSKTPTTKTSSAVNKTSQKPSKHQNANDKKEQPDSEEEISLASLENAQDSGNESTEASLGNSPPTGKPLRERQLLPLPHLGDIIPPPEEFAEYPGKKETILTKDSN